MYMHTCNVHVLETIQNLPFVMVHVHANMQCTCIGDHSESSFCNGTMIHVYVIVIAQLPVIYELN